MDLADRELRNATCRLFVELGRAPTLHEVAARTGVDDEIIRAGWHRLHDARELVLEPDVDEIRMAIPFSAVPTPYRVFADDRWWYANCAWDAFGVCAALETDGVVEGSCADCGEMITTRVVNRVPDDDTLVFHSLVPASQWWDNIVHT